MALPARPLGRPGLSVSVLSLGSWRTYERIPRSDGLAVMSTARDSGITFLDDARYNDETGTAPIPTGYSEIVFGEHRSGQPAGVDAAGLHDQPEVAIGVGEHLEPLQGVAVDHQQVGQGSRRDNPHLAVQPDQPRRHGRRRADHVGGGLHLRPQRELAELAAPRPGRSRSPAWARRTRRSARTAGSTTRPSGCRARCSSPRPPAPG